MFNLIKMGFLKVVFLGGQFDPSAFHFLFIFQEELIKYQYNFMQLLKT